MPSAKPVASAILATYNAMETLPACLDSLREQSVPIEIIVVDDGSTDGTRAYLRSVRNVRVLRQAHLGAARARNKGASHAKGDILLFVDADMTFDKNYVRDLIAPLRKPDTSRLQSPVSNLKPDTYNLQPIIGTYTSEERVANWDSAYARCWNYREGWMDGKRFPPNSPEWGTDFRAIQKAAFIRVHGFDDVGYTDTWTLFQKLGVRPRRTEAICYHANPETLTKAYIQAKWAAKRPYKYGWLGTVYALLRVSPPAALVQGLCGMVQHHERAYLPFRLVTDWGRFVGILEMVFTGKTSK